MIRLIVTASDQLYARLSEAARAEGDTAQRARSALQGFRRATLLGTHAESEPTSSEADGRLSSIVVDMSLHAADTLIEALHTRHNTSGIPLLAVQCDDQPLPLALRRLCVGILPPDGKRSGHGSPFEERTVEDR